MNIRILRKPDLRAKTGLPDTVVSRLEKSGLWPPRISITQRAVGWPEHEVDAVLGARIAGKADDEIEDLVKQLVAERQHAVAGYAA